MMTPWITSVGARCSVGLSALQVGLGMRADLVEPRSCALKNGRDEAVGMCRVGGLGRDVFGYKRLLALAAPALREALRPVVPSENERWPLLLALPDAQRPDHEPHYRSMATALANEHGQLLDAKGSQVVAQGHAGGVEVLQRASELLLAGADGVVVGGVDSFYHPEVVRWLDEAYRLHALHIDDGFVPGEAAAFLVLRTQRQKGTHARVIQSALQDEAAMLDEEQPMIAAAMTALFRDTQGSAARWVMTDVNNEHQRRREWRFVSFRHDLGAAQVQRLPEKVGDVGAASVPLMAATAFCWWSLGCAPASKVWLSSSSDGAKRGVAVLEQVTP